MEPYDILDKATTAITPWTGSLYDEVAILFETEKELEDFVYFGCEFQAFQKFNSVPRDTMVRQDSGGTFDVRFEFLRLPGRAWRIEAMCVLNGSAPIHEALLRRSGSGSVVHLSYKVKTLDDYAREARLHHEAGLFKVAEYRNSYGLFAYWRPLYQAGPDRPLVKPRINLRDQ